MFEGVYRELRTAKIAKLIDFFSRSKPMCLSTHVDHHRMDVSSLAAMPRSEHPEHGDGDPCASFSRMAATRSSVSIPSAATEKVARGGRGLGAEPDHTHYPRPTGKRARGDLCADRRSYDPSTGRFGRGGPHAARSCALSITGPATPAIPAPTLKARLSALARFEKRDARKGTWTHCLPSDPIVSATILAPHYANIPKCSGVVSSPVLPPTAQSPRDRGTTLNRPLHRYRRPLSAVDARPRGGGDADGFARGLPVPEREAPGRKRSPR